MADHTAWGLGTVERRSTTDQVLHELRTAILTGRIKPTEQLPEAALAQAFGTGRSAIREAIRQLVQEGLVITEINRGARVRPVSTDDLIDVYRARAAIEVAAVGALFERPDGFDIAPL
ncbi:MAG: GntR family transcriptional regulator, partial [Solirubrobacteraceae bacterium]